MVLGNTLVLCSPFSGLLVTEGGDPAVGVGLERTWLRGWNSRAGSDVAVTGPDGRFQFPAVTGRSVLASMLPHEPSIDQTIAAHGPDGPAEIWHASKHNHHMIGELSGRPINVICHLDREPSADGLFWGTCEASQGSDEAEID